MNQTPSTHIYRNENGVKVVHSGSTQDILSTLRSAIQHDSLLISACADVVDQVLLSSLPIAEKS